MEENMKPATNKEIELVGVDKLKEIDRSSSKEELDAIILRAVKQMLEHKKGLKDDQAIQDMKEDLKALKDAYTEIIKACEIIISRARDRQIEIDL